MADLLKKGAQFLAAQKRAHCTTTVTYRRGALSVSLPAERGTAELNVLGADNEPQVAVYDQAFWLNVADLELDSLPVDPRRGDRIETGGKVYEVNFPGSGRQPFLHDPHRQRFKVFCKEIRG